MKLLHNVFLRLLLLFCIIAANVVFCLLDVGSHLATLQIAPYLVAMNMFICFIYYLFNKVLNLPKKVMMAFLR